MKHWKKVMRWRWKGREFCLPVYDVPIKLTFSDAPYDIVKNELVAEADLKIWPEFK